MPGYRKTFVINTKFRTTDYTGVELMNPDFWSQIGATMEPGTKLGQKWDTAFSAT